MKNKTNPKSKSRTKTRVVAGVLSALTIMSVAGLTATTANAATFKNSFIKTRALAMQNTIEDASKMNATKATLSTKPISETTPAVATPEATEEITDENASTEKAVKTVAKDVFFTGLGEFLKIYGKTNPISGAVLSTLSAGFKSYLGTGGSSDTDKIMNELKDMSTEMKKDHDLEMTEITKSTLEMVLNSDLESYRSIKCKNIDVLVDIAGLKDIDICTADTCNEIKDETIRDNVSKNNFNLLYSYITEKTNGKNLLDQYLTFMKKTYTDPIAIKESCQNFADSITGEYAIADTLMKVGYSADMRILNLKKADLEEAIKDATTDSEKAKLESQKKVLEQTIDETHQRHMSTLEGLAKKAEKVTQTYKDFVSQLDKLNVCSVTTEKGVTSSYYSLADGWAKAVESDNSTLTLNRDVKVSNITKEECLTAGISKYFNSNALYLSSDTTVTVDLNGHTYQNGDYDCFYVVNNGTLNIKSSAKNGTISRVEGVGYQTSINLDGITVSSGNNKGVKVNKNCHAKLENTTFKDCKDSAVFYSNCSQKQYITNCIFQNNSSSDNGAAVNGDESYLVIKNCKFNDNHSDANGGAIFSKCSCTIDNCSFTGNSAKNEGGAVCEEYQGNGCTSKLDITDTTLTKNSADKGGAIYGDSMSYMTLKNVVATDNTCSSRGGGIYCQKGTASSCDPSINGRIRIINNHNTNGNNDNVFLGENTTSKCIFHIYSGNSLTSDSRIGVNSNTSDKDLDICKIADKSVYKNIDGVFSYDNSNYRIHSYNPLYASGYFVEIVRN